METGRFRWLAWDGDTAVGDIDCGTFDRWATGDERRATGDGRRATSDGRRATSDERRATSDERRATSHGDNITGTIDVPSGGLALTLGPACRRRGYGRQMLNALFEAAEVADIELFGGGVEPEIVPCLACLKAAGFSQQDPEPDFEGMVYFVRRR